MLSEGFFQQLNHTVTDDELRFLDEKRYLSLQRNSKYWNDAGLDLNSVAEFLDEIPNTERITPDDQNDDRKKVEAGAVRHTNLVGQNTMFAEFVVNPDILKCVNSVIGNDFVLSSMDMREPKKGSGWQGLHQDIPQRKTSGDQFMQCTAFIFLDDYSEINGAIRVVPKSHKEFVHIKSFSHIRSKRTRSDDEVIEKLDAESSLTLSGAKGDILILNVNTFHGGSTNHSGERRRVLFLNYRNRALRQQLCQFDHIPREEQSKMGEVQKAILHLYPPTAIERLKRFAYHNRHKPIVVCMMSVKKFVFRLLPKMFAR